MAAEIVEYGDAGLLVTVAGGPPDACWRFVQSLGTTLRREPAPGLVDVIAGFDTLFVSFDPLHTNHASLREHLVRLDPAPGPERSRLFLIPVRYGGEDGPDLADVATLLRLDPDEVVTAHTAVEWTVRMIGSPLGAPLMDGAPYRTALPRLATPRVRVAAGSVGLSGHQCIVYNGPCPGGWRLIGRTPLRLFDVDAADPISYRPGDRFRFRAIDAGQWDDWLDHPPLMIDQ